MTNIEKNAEQTFNRKNKTQTLPPESLPIYSAYIVVSTKRFLGHIHQEGNKTKNARPTSEISDAQSTFN